MPLSVMLLVHLLLLVSRRNWLFYLKEYKSCQSRLPYSCRSGGYHFSRCLFHLLLFIAMFKEFLYILGFGHFKCLALLFITSGCKEGSRGTDGLFHEVCSLPLCHFDLNILDHCLCSKYYNDLMQMLPFYILVPLRFLSSAAIIYSLCYYFTIPWLKKKAFAKYPQELFEFANTGKDRNDQLMNCQLWIVSSMESSDEIDTVAVVQQAGLNFPNPC